MHSRLPFCMFLYYSVFIFVQITSGEYIQMSGRAGRRGIDDRGIVMLMVDEQMDSTVGKNLLRVRSFLSPPSLSLSPLSPSLPDAYTLTLSYPVVNYM